MNERTEEFDYILKKKKHMLYSTTKEQPFQRIKQQSYLNF
jgi:hypothetical protein